MKTVAGIDGGGTSTRVALADATGVIYGIGVSGPSNYGSVSLDKVKEHIGEAFENAFDQAGSISREIDVIFMGMAGVVSDKDRETLGQITKNLEGILPKKVCVDHDIRISLAGGLAGKDGIALIAGTGSSCYGRDKGENSWMAGGWGHLLDDRGSAYDIARQALIAIVRAKDGRGLPTSLSDIMMEKLKINSITEIMRRLYFEGFRGQGYPMNKKEIASLAPVVIKCAEESDQVASEIIQNGIDELTLMVRTVADSLDFSDKISVVTTGGLVHRSSYVKSKLYSEIQNKVEGSRIYEPRFQPVIGALILALQHLDIDINKNVLKNLNDTIPQQFQEQ